jgi:hypothetical protein
MAASAPPLVRAAVVSPSVGQRGAHRLALRTPQLLEDAGGAVHGTKLLVDRHRNRALAVRAGRHELGVAGVVARVAPNGPALRLVAEDPQARRVLTRSGRVGAPSHDDRTLARASLLVEEFSSHVAAHEGIKLGGGGDHPSRSPKPPRGEGLA